MFMLLWLSLPSSRSSTFHSFLFISPSPFYEGGFLETKQAPAILRQVIIGIPYSKTHPRPLLDTFLILTAHVARVHRGQCSRNLPSRRTQAPDLWDLGMVNRNGQLCGLFGRRFQANSWLQGLHVPSKDLLFIEVRDGHPGYVQQPFFMVPSVSQVTLS